jgi:hypothetical protein
MIPVRVVILALRTGIRHANSKSVRGLWPALPNGNSKRILRFCSLHSKGRFAAIECGVSPPHPLQRRNPLKRRGFLLCTPHPRAFLGRNAFDRTRPAGSCALGEGTALLLPAHIPLAWRRASYGQILRGDDGGFSEASRAPAFERLMS